MCGIAGIAQRHDELLPELLERSLRHRGPDGGGVFRQPDASVALVARRLAILDLQHGDQPMLAEDGDYAIVFNGEIYNTPELRATLEREGVHFRTDHSDTELVLALYRLQGPSFLERLNGMFAFVIWDGERRELFGARDRLGIKPLYYARPGGGFAFASELRTLVLVPGIEREIDRQSLFDYLSLRFVPAGRSILRGVERLQPGHSFRYRVEDRTLDVERWWRLDFAPERGTREEWVQRVRDELRAAVVRWTLADVPVATSLSGGIDSSAVTALLAETGGTVRTYSLGFASGDDDGTLGELPLARALAVKHGTDHHEVVVDACELLDDLLQMVWALDEPYGGGLPSWYVFRFMAEDVKVGMTGTGGDELFGNYRRFVPFESGRLARVRRSSVRRYHFEPSYYFADDDKRRLLVDSLQLRDTAALLQSVFDDSGSRSARDGVLYLDATTQLPDEFLHMTDRFSMAHSLEARTPFLDHRLVELVANIPPDVRTSADDPKGLLREAVADLLTPDHLSAPKRGFVFPLARWLRADLRPLAERLLEPGRLRSQGLFEPSVVAGHLRAHLDGRSDESERLWPLLMFQLWHLLYIEEALVEQPSFSWQDAAVSV
ncbi:MAG: asparagine synthase (glutamine-hydrolyzing) [Gaiellaceae bacterium]